MSLPDPEALGLAPTSIIAVALDEPIVVYRCVMNNPPVESEFNHKTRVWAEQASIWELERTSVSGWETYEDADRVRTKKGSMVAVMELTPDNPRTHLAKTGPPIGPHGHISVWGPRDILCECTRVVSAPLLADRLRFSTDD